MRRLVTGLDDGGRPCVLEDVEVSFVEVMPGVGLHVAFETPENPLPARPPGRGDLLPSILEPGLVRWNIVEYEPSLEIPLHHTDTVDFDPVLWGSAELILDDGAHQLGPGDCVVVTGVDHAWRAGPAGCQLSVTTLGTPPLS